MGARAQAAEEIVGIRTPRRGIDFHLHRLDLGRWIGRRRQTGDGRDDRKHTGQEHNPKLTQVDPAALAARGGSRTEPFGADSGRMQGAAKRRILEVFKRAATPQTAQNPPERRRGDFRHGLLGTSPAGARPSSSAKAGAGYEQSDNRQHSGRPASDAARQEQPEGLLPPVWKTSKSCSCSSPATHILIPRTQRESERLTRTQRYETLCGFTHKQSSAEIKNRRSGDLGLMPLAPTYNHALTPRKYS